MNRFEYHGARQERPRKRNAKSINRWRYSRIRRLRFNLDLMDRKKIDRSIARISQLHKSINENHP